MKDFLADCLAAHRLTRLVVADEITEPLRRAVVAFALDVPTLLMDDDDRIGDHLRDRIARGVPTPWLCRVLVCRWCSGVWVGLGVALARRIAPKAWGLLADGLAAASVAGLLASVEKDVAQG